MKKINYLIFGLWMIFMLNGQVAAVCPLGTNLILNGDAEGNPAANGTGENVDVADWNNETAGFTIFRYGGGGTPATNSPNGPIDRGTFLFAGGNNSGNSSGSQTIDVSECAAQIDSGVQNYGLSGYFGGFENQNDNSRLTITFRDANNISLGTAVVGAVLAAERNNITEVLYKSTAGIIPIGTRTVTAVLLHTRISGNNNNGYADNLSFILTVPSAASAAIAGRVILPDGRGIGNVGLTLILPTGEINSVQTNSFGYYRFDEVFVGETYVLQIKSKRFRFAPDIFILSLTGEITELNFTAFEAEIN